MSEYPFMRRGHTLCPTTSESLDALLAVKEGREALVTFRSPRNIRHHKLFFAILKFLQMHAERFEETPIEKIKDAVKLATGLADTFIDAETHQTYYVLRSMSFASMDQGAFNSFFDSATAVIAKRWMPEGTTAEDVRKELLAMVDGPAAIGSRVA